MPTKTKKVSEAQLCRTRLLWTWVIPTPTLEGEQKVVTYVAWPQDRPPIAEFCAVVRFFDNEPPILSRFFLNRLDINLFLAGVFLKEIAQEHGGQLKIDHRNVEDAEFWEDILRMPGNQPGGPCNLN